jgi:hypothetical protein
MSELGYSFAALAEQYRRFTFNTSVAIFAHPEFLVSDWFLLVRPWGPPAEKEFLGSLIEADPDSSPIQSLNKITSALRGIPSGEREQL